MARTELQVLLNEPVTVVVGTSKKPIKVELREPVGADQDEYLALAGLSFQRFFASNSKLVGTAFGGGDVKNIAFDASELSTFFRGLIAKIVTDGSTVKADEKWVHQNLSIRQQAALLTQFAEVIGWEFIKETFLQATRKLMGSVQKSGNGEAPSWLSASSPTSPESTRNTHPKPSGGSARVRK